MMSCCIGPKPLFIRAQRQHNRPLPCTYGLSGTGVPEDGLPQDVLRFLQERIDTVPHLEALLIIWSSKTAWNAQQLSGRIYVDVASAQVLLLSLQRAGLLQSADAVSFEFDASWPGAQELVPRVSHTYYANIMRVTELIHGKPSSSILDFARAFDFKKER
jgi:hypothetical protein